MPDTSSHPPKGDIKKAEHYIAKLIALLDMDRIVVVHTDLNNFDKGALQDHFRVDLKDYRIEISHSKEANSLKDSYIMIFTNIGHINATMDESGQPQQNQKVILAYLQLETPQYLRFHDAALSQLERIRRIEEEQRFNQAVEPIDALLENPELIAQPEESTKTDEPIQNDLADAETELPPIESGPKDEQQALADYGINSEKKDPYFNAF